MHNITFTNENQSLDGYEVTWKSLPKAVKSMGGSIDDHYEGAKFIEIGTFTGVIMEDDFNYERYFALSDGSVLSSGELEEKGFDWS